MTFKVRLFDRSANATQADFPRSGHGAEAPLVNPSVPAVKRRYQRRRLVVGSDWWGVGRVRFLVPIIRARRDRPLALS